MFRNQKLYIGLVSLIPQILPLIDPALRAKYLPSAIKDYPNLSYKENGFPSISNYPSKVDVGNLFRDGWGGQKSTIDLKDHEQYNSIVNDLI